MTNNNSQDQKMNDATDTQVQISDEKLDSKSESNEKVGISLLSAILLNFVLIGTTVFAYHRFIAPKPVSTGVVDVQKIVTILENQTRQVLVEKVDATDSERNAAAYAFEQRMVSLQKVIKDIGAQCNCNLIVKAAVLNSGSGKVTDYTEQALSQLGGNSTASNPSSTAIAEPKPQELPATNAVGAPIN